MIRKDVPADLRPAVFTTALRALAQTSGKAVPEATPPDLSADYFGNVLLIHFAALAQLQGFEAYRDLELKDAALGHERHYWELLVGALPMPRPCFRPSSRRLHSSPCSAGPTLRQTPRPSSRRPPCAGGNPRSCTSACSIL